MTHSSVISWHFCQPLKAGMPPFCALDSGRVWDLHKILASTVSLPRRFCFTLSLLCKFGFILLYSGVLKAFLHVVRIWRFVFGGLSRPAESQTQCSPSTIPVYVSHGRKTTTHQQNKGNSPATMMKTTNNKSIDVLSSQEVPELQVQTLRSRVKSFSMLYGDFSEL